MINNALARNIVNLILFQVGWLYCAIETSLTAGIVALVLVVVHLVLISQTRRQEALFIAAGTALGSLLDGINLNSGVLAHPAQPVWTPLWLVGLWALFMTTLPHSLAWLGKKRWLMFTFAPIGGPFAYWSATRLGATSFPDPVVSFVALAVGWTIVLPLLFAMKRRMIPETPAS
ncbi:DUF2878 domain-containing protein [Marinobacter sp. 1Y8]